MGSLMSVGMGPLTGENWRLVIDEPVEFEK
jgi:hypothetical protein